MTLRVNVRNVWDRLSKRFKSFTRIENSEAPMISEMLQPVTNVDVLLKEVKMGTFTYTPADGTGWKWSGVEVPAGKRWQIHAISVAVANGTVNTFGVQTAGATVAYPIPIKLEAAASAYLYYYVGDGMFELEQGQELWLNVAADTGALAFTVYVYYDEEDAY